MSSTGKKEQNKISGIEWTGYKEVDLSTLLILSYAVMHTVFLNAVCMNHFALASSSGG